LSGAIAPVQLVDQGIGVEEDLSTLRHKYTNVS
jgi:hypothetical protein